MFSTLDGFINLINSNSEKIELHQESLISINREGDSLERYIKDGFCNLLNKQLDEKESLEEYSKVFSWTGAQNHPPDLMIRGGDAIEVKKSASLAPTSFQLNSSPPRQKMSSKDPMINQRIKDCENWTEKDVVYCLGSVTNQAINNIWFVYGDCFVASPDTYKSIKVDIKDFLKNMSYEMAETNELGRINNYDPLGHSSLRIRGMWSLRHPRSIFGNFTNQKNNGLYFVARKEKFKSFGANTINKLKKIDKIKSLDFKTEDPDNPKKSIECKILKYEI